MADKGDQEKLLKGKNKDGGDPQNESSDEEQSGGCPDRYEGIGN